MRNSVMTDTIAHFDYASLPTGTVLCGKYEIQKLLHSNSGEAVLYLSKYRNRLYVVKFYRHIGAMKEDVFQTLNLVSSSYVAKLYDTGVFEGAPFEILPYYKYGSLEGKTFSFETLEKEIIPELNTGLHALHRKGIIHKDLKPANIMLCDNQKDIAIIDFGISSIREDGSAVVRTKAGMTPEYAASETFHNLFLEESDYYSMGITLFELYCGRTPYKGMAKDAIEQLVSEQKISFPEDMPERLKDLITGLTYNDVSNRNDRNNPNRRWTYNEVIKWCKGETLPMPGVGDITATDVPMQPYTFYRKKYYKVNDLAYAMAINWENGKKHVFRSTMSEFFKVHNPDLANICMDAEEIVRADRQKSDIAFFQVIYQMAPEMKNIIWKGTDYGTAEDLGNKILDAAKSGSDENAFGEMAKEHLFSTYFASIIPDKKDIAKGLEAGEKIFINARKKNEQECSFMTIGRYLAKDTSFVIDGRQFDSLEEFGEYLLKLRKDNPGQLEYVANHIITEKKNLDPAFESWLFIMGKSAEIASWKDKE